MREVFEENIKKYNDTIKDAAEVLNAKYESEEEKDADIKILAELIDEELSQKAQERQTSVEAQRKIYRIQEQKREIFQNLKNEITQLDDPGANIEALRKGQKVSYENDEFWCEGPQGTRMSLTLGEIMTDGEWSLMYHLDETVPRNVRKRYLIESAKRRLRGLLDSQITIDETESADIDQGVKRAYLGKAEIEKNDDLPSGLIAEQMVRNIFIKGMYDAELDIEVISTDVYQDIYEKMDFVIRRKSRTRGVNVEDNTSKEIGIQFTTNISEHAQKRKKHQRELAKERLKEHAKETVDDIVIVSISLDTTREVYELWKQEKRPGGPDKLWDVATKERIFRGVLSDILTPEEISREWAKLNTSLGKAQSATLAA